ncbi:hypothetical protein F4677DRAFT_434795 [Hypoxylon crocopeplum]|nr:hypothetical protein F4677DRAFT_434795 [Hypoxylon crocopeplum]
MNNLQLRFSINDKALRLARILVSISVLCLSFNLLYPQWPLYVTLAGIVLFWGLIQTIDIDCGGTREINVVVHICLDLILVFISLSDMLHLGLWATRHCVPMSGCKYYWWNICSWGGLGILNGALAQYSIKDYPVRRRGGSRLRPRIMFTASGDPMAVAFNPENITQSINGCYSLDSLRLVLAHEDVNSQRSTEVTT